MREDGRQDGWHCFECNYVATKGNVRMRVTDWIWTGAATITANEVGHFWKVKDFVISEPAFKEVEHQSFQNAQIEFLDSDPPDYGIPLSEKMD